MCGQRQKRPTGTPLSIFERGREKACDIQLDCAEDGGRLGAQPVAAVAVATSTGSGAKQVVAGMALYMALEMVLHFVLEHEIHGCGVYMGKDVAAAAAERVALKVVLEKVLDVVLGWPLRRSLTSSLGMKSMALVWFM